MRIRLDYFLLTSYLALLVPLAIYCFLLFLLNRRSNPVMASGIWDSLGLLFAGSGFLLFSGPSFISWKFDVSLTEWTVAWIAYYVIVVVGSALLVWSRHNVTVIYNVDPDLLNQVLEHVLDKLGMTQTRLGHAVMIGPRQDVDVEEVATQALTEAPNIVHEPHEATLLSRYPAPLPAVDHRHRLDVEPFPAMCNVTLCWRSGSPALRQEVEDELRRNLDACRSLDNPAAGWFLGISGMLFGFVLLVLLLMLWAYAQRWL